MSDETMKFKCPYCGKTLEGPRECAGLETDCPACGGHFRLPEVSVSSAPMPNCLMCYIGMFAKYVGFRGRTRRREFWWATLFQMITVGVVAFIDGFIFADDEDMQGVLAGLFVLGSLIPWVALHVRRLHDTNKSGWWAPLVLMPVLNLAYLVWLVTDGDKGVNRFGADPKMRG